MIDCTVVENLEEVDFAGIFDEALKIMESIKYWKRTKDFSYELDDSNLVTVKTAKKDRLNGKVWASRTTEFENINPSDKNIYFQKFKKYLIGSGEAGKTHTDYEASYIHEISNFAVKKLPDTVNSEADISYITKVNYSFPFPFSKRVFYELVLIKKVSEGDIITISIPIDPLVWSKNARKDGVHAKYSSIERIYYEEDKDLLNWSMTTSSNAGGYLPNFIVNSNLAAAIAKDVPSFLNWSMKK